MSAEAKPSVRDVAAVWWPLAASWLLMAADIPVVSAVVARLAEPEVHLAAYGGVVFPMMLLIEAPVIMLLAASTALSKDWESYRKVRRFMVGAGATLTALHTLIAFTPLYDLIVEGIIDVPERIVEPARIGVMISIPWTWSIAYRRFQQGVLIRFGHSRDISVGTGLRLTASWSVLALAYALVRGAGHSLPGVAVAAAAMIAGVLVEAAFIGVRFHARGLAGRLRRSSSGGEELTFPGFLRFYVPLALTSLLSLLIQPLGAAALSRMPRPLESLATWPVVYGLLFMMRSGGVAYKEVVVAVLDRPDPRPALIRFTRLLATATLAVALLVAGTPLAGLWFRDVSGLAPRLAGLARWGIWFGILIPAFGVLQNWYVGNLVHRRRTRSVTESVAIFLVVSGILLGLGVLWDGATGLFVGLGAFTVGSLAQLGWVWHRTRQSDPTSVEPDPACR